MKKLRVLIADDHSMVRQGIRSVVRSQRAWELCGETDNGRTAVELARKLKPDIAVLDISMPGLNGVDAIPKVKAASPQTRVLILTMHDSESLADEVMRAGAHGYLLKSDAAELLPKAIASLAADKQFVSPKLPIARMNSSASPSKTAKAARYRLSPREREIVKLLAEGKTNREVAETLDISLATVETHRKNVLSKLRLGSTAELVRYAIRNNLIQL